MSKKYHIGKDDQILPCKAEIQCPLKKKDPNTPHFSTVQSAQKYLEHKYQKLTIPNSSKKRRKGAQKFIAVTGALVAAFTVSGCTTRLDADEMPDWKSYEQAQAEQQLDELQETVQDSYETAKETGGKLVRDSKDKVEQFVKENPVQLPELNKDNQTDSSTEITADDIFFQGKSLTPTDEEIAQARQNLEQLLVMPERDGSDYNRKDMFGDFKKSVITAVEMRDVTYNASFDDNGRAEDGSAFKDPYTGKVVTIIKGSKNDANIDHIVPLKEVYQSENPNKPLTKEQRQEIANDMRNLQLVGASVNKSKSDSDIAEYVPSYEPARCIYAIRTIEVKHAYDLTVDSAEKQAIQSILDGYCAR